MKYLILGVNGMAGHMAAAYLQEQGQSVVGFARKESPVCPTCVGDIRDQAVLEQLLEADTFDYVINCIGVLNQAVDQNLSNGIYLNSVLPHLLAERLQAKKAKLIHVSTDCVFEGTKGGYTEYDQPDAKSYYGRSKALGEVIDDRNLTIRTSIVGPELNPNGVGLFHWFMSQEREVNGFDCVIWSGVTTLELAKFILQDAEKPLTGLFHLVNNETICKYDLLQLFNHHCRQDRIRVNRDSTWKCDKSLQNTNPSVSVPDYEEMIQEMVGWMCRHPELYQTYLEGNRT